MTEKCLEFASNNKIISKIISFQNSIFYPIVVAVLTAFACCFDLDIYFIYLLTISTVFTAVFNHEFKPIFVTLLFGYYMLGLHCDISDMDLSNWQVGISAFGLITLISGAVIFLVAIIVRLALTHKLYLCLKRHAFTAGILALCTAFLLNGIWYDEYNTNNILMAIIEIAGFLPMYYIALCGLDGEKDVMSYFCKLCAILGGMIMLELIILILQLSVDGLFFVNGSIDRDVLLLGWGVNNLIGGMMALTIAPTMYLALKSKKYGWLILLYATLILVAVLVTQSRTSLLMGGIVYIISLILVIANAENKRAIVKTTIWLFVMGIIVFTILCITGHMTEIFSHIFGTDGQPTDNGRFEMWALGWDNFLKSPIFGTGFGDSAYPLTHVNYGTTLLLQNLYHNIFIQLIASMGVVGLIAFAVHAYQLFVFVKLNKHIEVKFLALMLLFVLLSSIFDNFFFYPNISIIYVIVLALCSHVTAEEDEKQTPVTEQITEN